MANINIDTLRSMKLNNDVEQAINLTKNPNLGGYMGAYSQLIGTTNENQKEIAKIINFKDKKVLVPGSSGDQYLSSVFYGSKEETIYDINVLTKYYIFLKICAMRTLKYDKLIEFILPFINEDKYLNPDMVKQLSADLPSHIKDFWNLYLGEIDIKKIGNLIKFIDNNISRINNKIPHYEEKNFYKLQNILNKKNYPEFIEGDISYFEYYIKDTYDFISLSNIIECSQQPFDDVMERRLYTNEEWIEYIKTIICKNLNPHGELLVCKTIDWASEVYEKAGFKKHIITSNNEDKNNIALVLKR